MSKMGRAISYFMGKIFHLWTIVRSFASGLSKGSTQKVQAVSIIHLSAVICRSQLDAAVSVSSLSIMESMLLRRTKLTYCHQILKSYRESLTSQSKSCSIGSQLTLLSYLKILKAASLFLTLNAISRAVKL